MVIRKNYDHFVSIAILLTSNILLALSAWPNIMQGGGGDWPILRANWLEGTQPFPAYWGSGQLYTSGPWSFGVDGAMFSWYSVSITIASWLQSITGIDNAANIIYLLWLPYTLGIVLVYPYMWLILKSRFGSIVACLAYSWCTHNLVGLNGGQWLVLGTASLFPVLLWSVVSLSNERKKNAARLTLIISGVTIILLDPRFIYVAALPAIVLAIFDSRRRIWSENVKKYFFPVSVLILTAGLTQAPWVIGVLIGNPSAKLVPVERLSESYVNQLSYLTLTKGINLVHPLFLSMITKHVSEYAWIMALFHVYFIAVLTGFWLGRRNPLLIFSACVFIVGVLLSKGTQEPFPNLYIGLFRILPGFSYFRDPMKWFVIVSLGAAPLIGRFCQGLIEVRIKYWHRKFNYIVVALFVFASNAWIIPIIANDNLRNGAVIGPEINNEVVNLSNLIHSNTPGRVLVIPWGDGQIEHSEQHSVIALYHLVGGAWAPFVPWGDTLNSQFSRLMALSFFPTLLEVSNIKYIIVPFDREGVVFGNDQAGFGPDNPGFSETVDMVAKITHLSRDERFSNFGVFKTLESQGLFLSEEAKPGYFLDGAFVVVDNNENEEAHSHQIIALSLPSRELNKAVEKIDYISRTRYIITIKQEVPSWINLSESFADGWKAFAVEESLPDVGLELSLKFLPRLKGAWWWMMPGAARVLDGYLLSDHRPVNGFMQAWRLPYAGNFRVVIEYVPQRAYEGGWLITLSAALVGVAVLVGWATYSGWKMTRGWAR